jgi:hypothetical protein
VYRSGEVQDLASRICKSKVGLGSDSKFPFGFPVGVSLAGKNQAAGIVSREESGDSDEYLNCIIFFFFLSNCFQAYLEIRVCSRRWFFGY